MSDLGGVWRTVEGRRIFIKDGEDLATAMKNSGKFGNKEEQKTPETLNNKQNLVDYFKIQTNIDLEKAITEKQFAPRKGLNIDSRKLDQNEMNTIKEIMYKKEMVMQSNGVYDYFIYYEKKK